MTVYPSDLNGHRYSSNASPVRCWDGNVEEAARYELAALIAALDLPDDSDDAITPASHYEREEPRCARFLLDDDGPTTRVLFLLDDDGQVELGVLTYFEHTGSAQLIPADAAQRMFDHLTGAPR